MSNTSVSDSWNINAQNWIQALQDSIIESRKITNPAIVDCILKYNPHSICDIGCGEGWLSHTLSRAGIEVTGFDATASLIAHAKNGSSQAKFSQLSYEKIIEDQQLPGSPYEAAVFNFCLYDNTSTSQLLNTVKQQLKPSGLIFIQTIHPFAYTSLGITYTSQWIKDSWKGLPKLFTHPHQWYFRTLKDWLTVFSDTELNLLAIEEPVTKDQQKLLSIIFVLEV